jgi:uncharacterized membrane protein
MAVPESQRADVGQVRMVALVAAGAMLGWMGFQWLGGQMGWPPKYVLLADLSAAAAFIWVMITAYRIWRKRQEK